MARVAFLGLGIMGAPMTVNLVRAGFDVVGWNRTLSKAEPVREAGGSVAQTPSEQRHRLLVGDCNLLDAMSGIS